MFNNCYRKSILPFYYFLQGVLGLIWWAILLTNTTFRKQFALYPDYPNSIISFILPDILFFCIGSFVIAFGTSHNKKWAADISMFLFGAIFYITLFLYNHYLITKNGLLATILMTLPCFMSGYFSISQRK
jgi:hypothetical protein